jgi:hypothetical protein
VLVGARDVEIGLLALVTMRERHHPSGSDTGRRNAVVAELALVARLWAARDRRRQARGGAG